MNRQFLCDKIKEYDRKYNLNITRNWNCSDDDLKLVHDVLYGELPTVIGNNYKNFVAYEYVHRFKVEKKHDLLIELYKKYPNSGVINPFDYFLEIGDIDSAIKCHNQYHWYLYQIAYHYYYNLKNIELSKQYFQQVYELGHRGYEYPSDILQELEFENNKKKFYTFMRIRKIEIELENFISNRNLRFVIINYLYE
jgi:hypothetical protein